MAKTPAPDKRGKFQGPNLAVACELLDGREETVQNRIKEGLKELLIKINYGVSISK